MTIIVETGAIVSGANSYVSLADADSYHSLRLNAGWTGTDAVKEAALVRAAQYIDVRYSFDGVPMNSEQPMAWPRYIWLDTDNRYVPSDSIPQCVKDAQCEVALLAISGELLPAQDRGGRIASQSVSGVAVSYFADAPSGRTFPLIDAILRRVTTSNGGLTAEAVRG